METHQMKVFLGLVWKKEIIDEIIAGNRRDDKYED